MKKWLSVGEAAIELGVCIKTLRRWDKQGKLQCKRTIGNHRRIDIFEIFRIRDGVEKHQDTSVAIYGRVSSHDQKKKGDLARQVDVARSYCDDHNYAVSYILSDVGSGLNGSRKGLHKLCKLLDQGKVSKVVLTYKDRLTRFGFEYLERYFSSHDVTVEVLHQAETKSMQEELVEDMIAIVTSFSGKVHGMRRIRI